MSATSEMLYAVLVASGLAAAGVQAVLPHMPRPEFSDYFEVNSVTAKREGDTAVLAVERTIKRPILMQYSVRVFLMTKEGAVLDCAASGGPYRYRPDALLPMPITLSWWTDGKCQTIPAGRVQIETTWDAEEPDFPPISVTTEVLE